MTALAFATGHVGLLWLAAMAGPIFCARREPVWSGLGSAPNHGHHGWMAGATRQGSSTAITVLVALAAGAAVAIVLGVFGREHDPGEAPVGTLGFASVVQMKFWLASVAGVLALGQLLGALWMYGRLGVAPPSWLGTAHRASGTLAVAVSLPVALHCLWSLGLQSYDTRVLVHSLAGCALYGAFVTKVVAVHARGGPGWLLPVAGGLLFTCFVVAVLSSAGWYYQEYGVPTGGLY